MIDNFLRPPRGLGELVADGLRGMGILSLVFAAVFLELTDAGIFAFTLPGLLAPRFIGMRPWADAFLSGTLLVAAWSNILDLYGRIGWWDLVVHFFCAGTLAVGSYLFLARLRMVPVPFTTYFTPAAGIVLTTAFGLALGGLWEMVEWLGYTYITPDIHVTYQDTIGDMAAGGLGALCMSLGVAYLPLVRPVPGTSEGETEALESGHRSDGSAAAVRVAGADPSVPVASRTTSERERDDLD